jgi:enterochelin esterase family protein
MRNPDNRAAEYDSLTDAYARFVVEELLPEVGKSYNLTSDPERRAIGGASSGAICAFTVAWRRPDQFRGVISLIGSYTSIGYRPAGDGGSMQPGGDLYPTLVRKSEIKPLSVFLQDGSNDLDNEHGNWFLANQQMLAAFEYKNRTADALQAPGARYDVRHAWGDAAHNDQHGGAILPDILRWLWGSAAR